MFRFTIRELVLLTLVVATGVGWWMDRQRVSDSFRLQGQKLAVWQGRANQLKMGCEQIGYAVTWASDERQTSPIRVVIESAGEPAVSDVLPAGSLIEPSAQ